MPPKVSKILCAGCSSEIKNKECLECPLCKKTYDLACTNITSHKFRAMSLEQKQKWCCPECHSKKPKSNDCTTPVRSLMSSAATTTAGSVETSNITVRATQKRGQDLTGQDPSGQDPSGRDPSGRDPSGQDPFSATSNVTLRAPQKPDQGVDGGQAEIAFEEETILHNTTNLSQMIKNEIRLAFKTDVPILLRRFFETELAPIRAQLDAIEASASFTSSQFDDIAQKMKNMSQENKDLRAKCEGLHNTVVDLQARLNAMEQHMRNSNIEIQGVPEHRTENVVTLVNQIAQVVSYKLSDADIITCSRVASLNKQTKRPRSIVVKLRSPRCRDEFYSAVSKYNKSNPKSKLNSGLVGIAGDRVPIYVSEHLSPANKALHAAARLKGKELGYRYVWVRNGQIFMRKDDSSRFIHIKNEQTLSTLT